MCALYAVVREILQACGVFLVCDDVVAEDGMSNTELYMTADEQSQLLQEEFPSVRLVLKKAGMALWCARQRGR